MSRKSHRRKKQSTGMLSWFRSQQNITKVVYWIVALVFVGGAFMGFGGSLGGGGCSGGGQPVSPEHRAWLDETVAKVGEWTITRGEFLNRWRVYEDRDRRAEEEGVYVPPPEENYILRWDVLNGMVMQALVEQEALNMGVIVEQSDIDEQIELVKQSLQLGTTEEGKRSLFERIGELLSSAKEDKNFKARLWEYAHQTPKQLEDDIRLRILAGKFGQKVQEEITSELDSEGRAKADEIVDKINDGADFEELVAEYSDDPAAKETGGKVEDVNRGSPQPQEIIDNAFSLAVGETSPPFKVRQEIDNPYQQGQKISYEYYVILQVTDKRVGTGEEFEANLEEIREELRQEKWEKEKRNNPEIKLEDIDVSDEDIANEYESVSFSMIRVDSINPGLINERTEKKLTDMKEGSGIEIVDPEMSAWDKVANSDFEGARNDWALFISDTEAKMSSPEILELEGEELEDSLDSLEQQKAVLNYVNGLIYRIQIEGYPDLRISGEKTERAMERWEAYQEDPEAYGDEVPNIQEPTEEEKEHYRQINEEALPYFDKAIEVIMEDAYMYINRGETRADLELYVEAFDDFKNAYEYTSDDLQLNSRLQRNIAGLLGFIDDEEKAKEIMALGEEIGQKVARLQAEMEALQQQMQQMQQGQGMGGMQ